MKNVAIEGHTLDLEQIYNGMVVISMAGYPLTFQHNPFRLDNVSVLTNSCNSKCTVSETCMVGEGEGEGEAASYLHRRILCRKS